MTGLGELGVTLAFLASFGGLGKGTELSGDWVRNVEYDAFTDELVAAHAVTFDVLFDGNDEVPGALFVLGVGCKLDEAPIVFLAGTSFDPSSMPAGDWNAYFGALFDGDDVTVPDSPARHDIPVRFDREEPTTRPFTVHGDSLGLVGEPVSDFLKALADWSRLRVKFPHAAGDIVLDFSLDGSRNALAETLRECALPELASMLAAAARQADPASGQTRQRDRLLAQYSLAIQAVVERNWIRPPGAPARLSCVVRVTQAPSGDVVTVEIAESSGNRTFDNSVENAVWKSSPLPLPQDVSLFRRDLQFVFDPQG